MARRLIDYILLTSSRNEIKIIVCGLAEMPTPFINIDIFNNYSWYYERMDASCTVQTNQRICGRDVVIVRVCAFEHILRNLRLRTILNEK